jgi:hypothetical protein
MLVAENFGNPPCQHGFVPIETTENALSKSLKSGGYGGICLRETPIGLLNIRALDATR